MTTLLRSEEHTALRSVELSGTVLDLGGDTRSEYQTLFKGTYTLQTFNNDPKAMPDILGDLEEPLQIGNASFDGVLLINVLEHVFEYRRLLSECARVLRARGDIVIVVPFLFPYHASPHDFHRYTEEALSRALTSAGFTDVNIKALGSGVFAARLTLLERLLPTFLFPFLVIARILARLADTLFLLLAKVLGKKYTPRDYPLGYVVTATKG